MWNFNVWAVASTAFAIMVVGAFCFSSLLFGNG